MAVLLSTRLADDFVFMNWWSAVGRWTLTLITTSRYGILIAGISTLWAFVLLYYSFTNNNSYYVIKSVETSRSPQYGYLFNLNFFRSFLTLNLANTNFIASRMRLILKTVGKAFSEAYFFQAWSPLKIPGIQTHFRRRFLGSSISWKVHKALPGFKSRKVGHEEGTLGFDD